MRQFTLPTVKDVDDDGDDEWHDGSTGNDDEIAHIQLVGNQPVVRFHHQEHS